MSGNRWLSETPRTSDELREFEEWARKQSPHAPDRFEWFIPRCSFYGYLAREKPSLAASLYTVESLSFLRNTRTALVDDLLLSGDSSFTYAFVCTFWDHLHRELWGQPKGQEAVRAMSKNRPDLMPRLNEKFFNPSFRAFATALKELPPEFHDLDGEGSLRLRSPYYPVFVSPAQWSSFAQGDFTFSWDEQVKAMEALMRHRREALEYSRGASLGKKVTYNLLSGERPKSRELLEAERCMGESLLRAQEFIGGGRMKEFISAVEKHGYLSTLDSFEWLRAGEESQVFSNFYAVVEASPWSN